MKEFAEKFERDVEIALKDMGLEPFYTMRETVKKANRTYEALTIMPEGGNLGINIDLSTAYEQWKMGMSYWGLVEDNAEMVNYYLHHKPDINPDMNLSFEAVRSSLMVQLVSAEENEELLDFVPYTPLLDMAVIYRVMSSDEYSILITDSIFKEMSILLEELHAAALENSARMRPARIDRIQTVLDAMRREDIYIPEFLEPERDMHIATNSMKYCGAAVLAYPGFLKSAADYLDSSFYILPSSIHELILIPDGSAMPAVRLKGMVTAINAAEVDPADKLTDNVYHYDREAGILEYGETYEARAEGRMI